MIFRLGKLLALLAALTVPSLAEHTAVGRERHGGGRAGRVVYSPGRYPADCRWAHMLNEHLRPTVDCFYAWEHWWWDNYLYYVIRISPSGQETPGWAKGIRDNIAGECGIEVPRCGRFNQRLCFNNDYYGQAEHNGTVFYGLEMSVPIWKWKAGEDDRECVASAIRKASCGVKLAFKAGSCYKKRGSFHVPVSYE